MVQATPKAVTQAIRKLVALPNCSARLVGKAIPIAQGAPPTVLPKKAAIYVTINCAPLGQMIVVQPEKGSSIHVVAKNVRITLGLEQGVIMEKKKPDVPPPPTVRRITDGLLGLDQILAAIRSTDGTGEPREGSRYQQANTMQELEVKIDHGGIIVTYVYECRAVEISVPCLEGTNRRELVRRLRKAIQHPGINLEDDDPPPYRKYAIKKKAPKKRRPKAKPTESS